MANERKDGGPAFPPYQDWPGTRGMSLRDWFAGQCAATIIGGITSAGIDTTADDAMAVAKSAYTLADAMLAERNK